MKRDLFFLLSILAITLYSCDEIGPNINFSGNGGGNDTTGTVDTNQQKTVLIEDFTATNCPNCPKGRAIIDDLIANNPGRIEVVEVHQGPLSQVLEPGDPDLMDHGDADDLAGYLGGPPFWPCGAIDRKSYETSPGTFERLVDRGLWTTYTQAQLATDLQINLGLDFNYDDGSRILTGSVTVKYLQTITDPLHISVLITESGIVAAQIDGLTLIPGYVHEDVLRDVITYYAGENVGGETTAGSSWTYNLPPYTVSPDWNADSCRVIAFVSKAINNYDVLQAMGTPLKN